VTAPEELKSIYHFDVNNFLKQQTDEHTGQVVIPFYALGNYLNYQD
jgi:hypothetical protein